MMKKEGCVVIGRKQFTKKDIKRAQKLIREKYRANLLVDELPVGEKAYYTNLQSDRDFYYEKGFSVGEQDMDNYYWNNHVSLTIKYHRVETGYRIVGFEADPKCVQHKYDGAIFQKELVTTCNEQTTDVDSLDKEKLRLGDEVLQEIIYSYSVNWQEDPDTEWASRWDLYIRYIPGSDVHWFTLGNSILISVFLTIMVALIMIRTVYSDIARYNSYIQLDETKEEIQEESGWKLVHGDVFRPPTSHPMLFAIVVGTGVQLLWMCIVLTMFALLGFLSPAIRGSLITAALFIFIFMGAFAGYSAARLYKLFKGVNWKTMTIYTALFFPGIIFGITFIINFFFWFQRSTRAIPFCILYILYYSKFIININYVVWCINSFSICWSIFRFP